jgi:hypothetical protein
MESGFLIFSQTKQGIAKVIVCIGIFGIQLDSSLIMSNAFFVFSFFNKAASQVEMGYFKISFTDVLSMPKVEVANTLECSGNGRSLLQEKASGNPWTIGGVGNAIRGGADWLMCWKRQGSFLRPDMSVLKDLTIPTCPALKIYPQYPA